MRDAGKYFGTVFVRSFLSWERGEAMTSFVTISSAAAVALIPAWATYQQETSSWLWVWLFGLFGLIFFVITPFRMWRDAHHELIEIKEDIEPKLNIEFDESFFDAKSFSQNGYGEVNISDTPDGQKSNRKTFYVRVTTNSPTAIEDCKLNIEYINKDGKNILNFIDSLVRRTTENEVFPVRNGDPKDVNVVCLDEVSSRLPMEITFFRDCYKNTAIDRGEYEISLVAVGKNTSAKQRCFRIWVENDFLKMKPVS